MCHKPDTTSTYFTPGEGVTVYDTEMEAMGRPCSEITSFGDPAMPEAINSWVCQVNKPTNPFLFILFKLVIVAFCCFCCKALNEIAHSGKGHSV